MYIHVDAKLINLLPTDAHKYRYTVPSRHTFLLHKEVNWEVHDPLFGTLDMKENALVCSHTFGHLTQQNRNRNGWRVHVLLHSKLQLSLWLISFIALLILNVVSPNLNRSYTRALGKTCNRNRSELHKARWFTYPIFDNWSTPPSPTVLTQTAFNVVFHKFKGLRKSLFPFFPVGL